MKWRLLLLLLLALPAVADERMGELQACIWRAFPSGSHWKPIGVRRSDETVRISPQGGGPSLELRSKDGGTIGHDLPAGDYLLTVGDRKRKLHIASGEVTAVQVVVGGPDSAADGLMYTLGERWQPAQSEPAEQSAVQVRNAEVFTPIVKLVANGFTFRTSPWSTDGATASLLATLVNRSASDINEVILRWRWLGEDSGVGEPLEWKGLLHPGASVDIRSDLKNLPGRMESFTLKVTRIGFSDGHEWLGSARSP